MAASTTRSSSCSNAGARSRAPGSLRSDGAMTRDIVPGASALQALACHGGIPRAVSDWVADEVPVALQYNGISHAVMLATPLDLEDFAYGFSLGEGLVDRAGDVHDVEVEPTEQGI